MRVHLLLSLVLLVLSGHALSSASTRRLFSGRAPHGWVRGSKAHPAQRISVVFGVRQRNLDVIEDWVLKVSDPSSPFFGQHLSRAEVRKLTMNTEALVELDAFLRTQGVLPEDMEIFPENFIRAKMTVGLASRLLGSTFHQYTHVPSGKSVVRTRAYSVPSNLAHIVEFVSVTTFPAVRRPAPRVVLQDIDSPDALPPGYTVPSVLFKYYNISSPTVKTSSATQSVYESLDQSYSPTDLAAFQKQFGLPSQAVSKVIGPNTPTACTQNPNNCVEANLDVQYIMAIAQGAPLTYWSIASSDPSPWVDWVLAVAGTTNPPLVHSISYGDVEQQDDPTEQNRFNTEVMKLGAQGISVIIASGDDGVANFPARSDASACGFFPSFPASATYVTAVGATMGPENNTAEIAETSDAGGGITTGGGFSTVFSRPSYQSAAVSNYFNVAKSTLPPVGAYNASGRGYPDVSILGHNYVIEDGGQLSGGSGTSASAPVFAGMISLVNSQRLAAGKSALGFLNPILYQTAAAHPEAFHDITQGKNNCCAGDPGKQVCCKYGFTAAQGWDPLTGLGSINFDTFAKILVAL